MNHVHSPSDLLCYRPILDIDLYTEAKYDRHVSCGTSMTSYLQLGDFRSNGFNSNILQSKTSQISNVAYYPD